MAAAAPALAMLALAWSLRSPLPLDDYWDALREVVLARDGGWHARLSYYWEPFFDQRMPAVKLAIDLLELPGLSRGLDLQVLLGWGAQAGVLAALAAWARGRAALTVGAALILFWPGLIGRFTHHWYSIQYSLVTLGGVAALLALERRPGRWSGLALAAAAAAVSAGAHGTGALLLPAIGLCLGPGWSRTQRRAWWLGTIAALLAAGAQPREGLNLPPWTAAFGDPLRLVRYFLECLGPPAAGLPLGAAALALNAWFLKTQRQPADRPWRLIIIWSLATAAATAAARSSIEARPKEVYFSFFALFQIAALHSWLALPSRPKAAWLAAPALAAVYLWGAAAGLTEARERRDYARWAACALRWEPVLSAEDTRGLFPWGRLRELTLPALDARGRLEGLVDRRPLPEGAPAGTPSTEGANLLVAFSPPLPNDALVGLDVRAAPGWDGAYEWLGDAGWRRALSPLSARRSGSRAWLLFCDGSGPVRAVRMSLSLPGGWGSAAGLRVYSR